MSIKRNIANIAPQPLNHDSGEKQVLFNYMDADSPCRQISIAKFRKGDVCEIHSHPTLDEHFYWQSGSGEFTIGCETTEFHEGDYIFVPAGTTHAISFDADSQCLCIGIALDWQNKK